MTVWQAAVPPGFRMLGWCACLVEPEVRAASPGPGVRTAEGNRMVPGVQPNESPVERYRRELRDLMVAEIDFRRLRAPLPPARPGACP